MCDAESDTVGGGASESLTAFKLARESRADFELEGVEDNEEICVAWE